ncbi:MAG TPA: hypothetical protein VMH80_06205 [Bryobacteraceae bacterium]|nr:hypothetical protein [Bryobacteraceae bacterium]
MPGSKTTNGETFSSSGSRFEKHCRAFVDYWAEILTRHPYVFLVLVSLAYFLITIYRAQRKLFWFDELFTFYIARLPDLGSIWAACKSGADFNPPLLYLLTRWSQAVFGAAELGTRMPQIVGFWLFCLCLYRLVSVRGGVLAGFIALLFPLTTGGYWYAYEARSYGLVLGFFGLALICWQALAQGSAHRTLMLAGLTASLTCAALCHAYAFLLLVPLGLGELARTILRRRFDSLAWCALLLPLAVLIAILAPLLRAIRAAHIPPALPSPGNTIWSGWDLSLAPHFALAVVLLLAAQSLWVAVSSTGTRNQSATNGSLAAHEIVALGALLGTPLFVFIATRAAGVPSFGRYSLIAMAGFACLLGAACTQARATGLAVVLISLLFCAGAFWQFYRGSFVVEPSTRLKVATRDAGDAFSFKWLTASAPGDEPIVLADDLEFASMFHYAPAPIRSRFVFLVPDVNGEGYSRLQSCCGAPGIVMSTAAFLAAHRSFFVYGTLNRLASQAVKFRRKGGQITIADCHKGRCLCRAVFLPAQSGVTEDPAVTNTHLTHEQL